MKGTNATSRRRVCLVNGLRPETSVDLYDDIATRLRARSLDVDVIHGSPNESTIPSGCAVVFSNMGLPLPLPDGARVFAGRAIARPTSLRLLKDAGVATMQWRLARTRRDVRALFSEWNVPRVLLKRSFTFGGRGTDVFTRGAAWRLRWNRELDVFCSEVNPDDGNVHKVELLNGRILISWVSEAPPIRTQFRRGVFRGLKGAYGDRSLWDVPVELAATLTELSRRLTRDGLGHVSVDLMRRADGTWVAIELNPRGVATWWSRGFEEFRERYAQAIYDLAVGDGPAGP